MEQSLDGTADHTISLLEARLRRIEYVVIGEKTEIKTEQATTATERLRDLEIALDRILAKSKASQDLLRLQAHHPDLFNSQDGDSMLASVSSTTKLPIVLAAASSYPQTASRLTSILDMPVPPTESSAQLVATRANVARLEILQDAQILEITSLKQRSAAVLQRWYSVDIVKAGECWVDIEGRVELVEQNLRRAAVLRQQEEAGE